jgi:hypothetical protein
VGAWERSGVLTNNQMLNIKNGACAHKPESLPLLCYLI